VLIVLGDATAAPGRRDELVAAARAVAAATRGDDGCLAYRFAADLEDPDRILGIEIWRDQAALDAHMDHDHTHRFLAVAPGLLAAEPTMTFHSVPDPDADPDTGARPTVSGRPA
jgi:quinol monooxygenase YgiN